MSLTWNEALSGVFGSISLAAWIFVLIPQLVQNYKQKSADGISLTFLLIWTVGDVANLVGAIWAQLVPTVIAIAAYYCLAGTVLIVQCIYYNKINSRARVSEVGERAPLLGNTPKRDSFQRRLTDITEENLGLPGSRRRSSGAASRRRISSDNRPPVTLENILEEPTKVRTAFRHTAAILGICLIGTVGWVIAWKTGTWKPAPLGRKGHSDSIPVGAEILGYVSAVLYLGARIPQIVKNQRDRSVDGLSLLFFILSLLGNATYGAGILFHSVEKNYVLINLPWLIGSLGTMAEDVTVFIQFSIFGERHRESAIEQPENEAQGRVL